MISTVVASGITDCTKERLGIAARRHPARPGFGRTPVYMSWSRHRHDLLPGRCGQSGRDRRPAKYVSTPRGAERLGAKILRADLGNSHSPKKAATARRKTIRSPPPTLPGNAFAGECVRCQFVFMPALRSWTLAAAPTALVGQFPALMQLCRGLHRSSNPEERFKVKPSLSVRNSWLHGRRGFVLAAAAMLLLSGVVDLFGRSSAR